MRVHLVHQGFSLCGYPIQRLPTDDKWVGKDHRDDAPVEIICSECINVSNDPEKYSPLDEDWLVQQAGLNETGVHIALAQALLIGMNPGDRIKFSPGIIRAFRSFDRMKELLEKYTQGKVDITEDPFLHDIYIDRLR